MVVAEREGFEIALSSRHYFLVTSEAHARGARGFSDVASMASFP
jgi:hypothetical protein